MFLLASWSAGRGSRSCIVGTSELSDRFCPSPWSWVTVAHGGTWARGPAPGRGHAVATGNRAAPAPPVTSRAVRRLAAERVRVDDARPWPSSSTASAAPAAAGVEQGLHVS